MHRITGGIARLWEAGGPTLILGRTLRRLSDELVALSAPRVLKSRLGETPTVEDVVDLVIGPRSFDHYGDRVSARQVREEIRAVLELIEREPPHRVLEIGTFEGGTLLLFARVAASDAVLVSLDLPGTGFGVGYPPRQKRLYRAFAFDGQTVHPVRKDSHEISTLELVVQLLGAEIDFLFIDGDHSYEGVKRDYEMYGPLVRPGGLIAFHDIVGSDVSLVGGVPRFWAEVKARYFDVYEFVNDRSQRGYGIGVVRNHEQDAAPASVVMPPPLQPPTKTALDRRR
jgi:predicted O-methyltransferase YrrM